MLSNTTITHNMPMTNAVRVIILHWFIIRAALIILTLVLIGLMLSVIDSALSALKPEHSNTCTLLPHGRITDLLGRTLQEGS